MKTTKFLDTRSKKEKSENSDIDKKHVFYHPCLATFDIKEIDRSINSGFHDIPANSSPEEIHKLLMS